MKKLLVVVVVLVILSVPVYVGFNTVAHKTKTPVAEVTAIDSLVVYKAEREMHAYLNGQYLKTYKISLGSTPKGHKHFEGDRKTPEGLYTINDRNPNSGYHKNLGISYPNADDIAYARERGKPPGGEIKIHGLPNGQGYLGKLHLASDWTHGCIAVTDEEVDELYECVATGSPIYIIP